jgi:SPP1 gp7 family putative phage head morphogenesis protein
MALINGLTQGQNPKVIARAVIRATDIGANAAETITHTMIMNALNMAEAVMYEQAGITHERILAALDSESCAECLYRDGKIIKVSQAEQITMHPNCRCVGVAVTDWPKGERRGKDYSDSERGRSKVFPAGMTGKEYLRNLPQPQMEKVLGYNRVRLMNADEVKFDDFWNAKGELIPLKTLCETSQHGG